MGVLSWARISRSARYYILPVSIFPSNENQAVRADSREYPDRPILGVGGVVVYEGRVLLARRARAPLLNQWSIPGGKVESGETLHEAVRRELAEETSLDVRVLDLIEVVERIERDDAGRVKRHYVVLDYLCERITGEACAASDATEVAWAAPADLVRFSLTNAATRVIRRAFELVEDRSLQM
jgi:8-oxo-dGTP diphosphatase